MGWTSLHRDPGTTDREFFEREFPNMLGRNGRIVACATVRGAFYAAVRQHDDAEQDPGQTWALVVLVRRGRGRSNFSYKEMSETMGPAVDDAPAAVLDALSPTSEQWALEWRERCRAKLAARSAAPKVKRGDVVVFAQPLRFSDGREATRFRLAERTTFTFVDSGRPCRIPNWRTRQFSVEAN